MNKKVWSLLTFMMVAMLSVGFVSCGDDDEDGGLDLSGDPFCGSYSQCWTVNESSEIVSYIRFYDTGDGKDYEIRDSKTSGKIIGHYQFSQSSMTLTLTPVVYIGTEWEETYATEIYSISNVTSSSITLRDGTDEIVLKKIDYQTYKNAVEK